MQRLLPLFHNSYANIIVIENSINALKTLSEFILQSHSNDSFLELNSFSMNEANISLRSIGFCYPNATNHVFSCINLDITHGQTLGIVGPSGCGKSTLCDIMMGFIKPTNGSCSINNIDIYKRSNIAYLKSWRENVAHVPQDVYIYNASLLSNISLEHNPANVNLTRALASLESACLQDLIAKKPIDKFMLSERGAYISVGQRQRVGIARALYRGCKVLILDEPTSALDLPTEVLLKKTLQNLCGSLTIIIVTHRTELLQICDLIYRLDMNNFDLQSSK